MQEFNNFINDLAKLISINTQKAEPTPSAPFGEGNKEALHYFLSLAKSFGFETVNYDNYIGEVIFGSGEEFGIIGHLDVVPAGEGWDTDPFTLTEKDGAYFGRGTIDDKAPLLICLYALKELKDEGFIPNKKFRLIAGTNEETGWKDIEYFNKVTSAPTHGFSPDGNFPLSYAEKGVAIVKFSLEKFKNFYDLKGGTVINAVCAKASVKAKDKVDKSLLKKYNLNFLDGVIESVGKTAHGSSPSLGVNALKNLFLFLLESGENVKEVIDNLFTNDYALKGLESEQGQTTLSPNLAYEKDGNVFIECDCRFPYPIEFNDLLKVIDKFNISYTASEKHPTQYVEKDGEMIRALIKAYNKGTNENGEPISLGGSTFARVFNKGVSFGPEFYGSNSGPHEANENIKKDEIIKCFNIYKNAIININGVKNL